MQTRTDHPVAPPVFILSCERSGSTLLRYIMDTHPQICSPGQLYVGELCQSLYKTLYYSSGQAISSEPQRVDYVHKESRRIIEELMERYTSHKGKSIWCDKTTLNLNHSDLISKVFPDAKFICLYRHCMDVSYSCLRYDPFMYMDELVPFVSRNPQNIVEAMMDSWIEKTGKISSFERANATRCHRIKYEDLTTNPRETLMPLFEFLGVEWDPSIPDRVFSAKHDRGHGDMKVTFSRTIHTDSVGGGANISRYYISGEFSDRADVLLMQLGYDGMDGYYRSFTRVVDPVRFPKAQSGDEAHVYEELARRLATLVDDGSEYSHLANRRCKVTISDRARAWVVDMNEAGGAVLEGDGPADCAITLSLETLNMILNEELNPMVAFQDHDLVVAGDVELAATGFIVAIFKPSRK
jgi:protein-tyrosine sulfotransferase